MKYSHSCPTGLYFDFLKQNFLRYNLQGMALLSKYTLVLLGPEGTELRFWLCSFLFFIFVLFFILFFMSHLIYANQFELALFKVS